MDNITAELLDIQDPVSKENQIYLKFTGEKYKGGENFIPLSPDEFNALVKLFVDKIVATAKQKNEKEAVGGDTGSGN